MRETEETVLPTYQERVSGEPPEQEREGGQKPSERLRELGVLRALRRGSF